MSLLSADREHRLERPPAQGKSRYKDNLLLVRSRYRILRIRKGILNSLLPIQLPILHSNKILRRLGGVLVVCV